MGRYLLYISYIGRGFSGLQKQRQEGVRTICGLLEQTLQRLRPANEVHVFTSSRTDKGVNALCNTVHVDLKHREEGKEFHPDRITSALNQFMLEYKVDVRVLKTCLVSDDFHSRFRAMGREYIYRICRVKQAENLSMMDSWKLPVSPLEYLNSYLVRQPLDMEKVREAADLLSGTHDYSAFSVPNSIEGKLWVNPVKSLQIDVKPGQAFMGQHLAFYDETFEHWDLHYSAGSFLHKQIRKMTAVIVGVGAGVVDLDLVRAMRDDPKSEQRPNDKVYIIPAYALYLKNVKYKDEDLASPPINHAVLCGPYTHGLVTRRTKTKKSAGN